MCEAMTHVMRNAETWLASKAEDVVDDAPDSFDDAMRQLRRLPVGNRFDASICAGDCFSKAALSRALCAAFEKARAGK